MGWMIDDVDLATLAFNVVNRSAGWKVPAKRGENLVIPGRHGAQWLSNKPFDQGSLALTMWANGAHEDGTLPTDISWSQQCRVNLDKLTALFAQSHRLLTVQQIGQSYGIKNVNPNPAFAAGGSAQASYQNYILNPYLRRVANVTQVANLFPNPNLVTGQNPLWVATAENLVPDPSSKYGRTSGTIYSPGVGNYWFPSNYESFSANDTLSASLWTPAASTTATVQNASANDQVANPLGGTKVFRVSATAGLVANAMLGTRPGFYISPAGNGKPLFRCRTRRNMAGSVTRGIQVRISTVKSDNTTVVLAGSWQTFMLPAYTGGAADWTDVVYNPGSLFLDGTNAVNVKIEFRTNEAWLTSDSFVIDCCIAHTQGYPSHPNLVGSYYDSIPGPYWDGATPWGCRWNTAGNDSSVGRWDVCNDTRWLIDLPTGPGSAYWALVNRCQNDPNGTTLSLIGYGFTAGGPQNYYLDLLSPTAGEPYSVRFTARAMTGTTATVDLLKKGVGDADYVSVGSVTVTGSATNPGTGILSGATTWYLIPAYYAATGDLFRLRVTAPVRTDGIPTLEFIGLYCINRKDAFSGDNTDTVNSQFAWAGTPYNSKSTYSQRRIKRVIGKHAMLSSNIPTGSSTPVNQAEVATLADGQPSAVTLENITLSAAALIRGLYIQGEAIGASQDAALPAYPDPTCRIDAQFLDNTGALVGTVSGMIVQLSHLTGGTGPFNTVSLAVLPTAIPATATQLRVVFANANPRYGQFLQVANIGVYDSYLAPTAVGGSSDFFSGASSGATWVSTAEDSASGLLVPFPTAYTVPAGILLGGSVLSARSVTTPARVAFGHPISPTQSAAQWLAGLEVRARVEGSQNPGALVATNLVVNPTAENGGGWNSSSGASYTLSLDTTAPISGAHSAMTTRVGTLSSTAAGVVILNPNDPNTAFPVSAGASVAYGVDVKVERANRRLYTYIDWFDAAYNITTSTSVYPFGQGTTLNPGQVYRATNSDTAPPGTIGFRVRFYVQSADGSNVVAGERVWFDNASVVVGGDGTYFDGDTPDSGGYTYNWTGAAQFSTSEKRQATNYLLTGIPVAVTVEFRNGSTVVTSVKAATITGNDAAWTPIQGATDVSGSFTEVRVVFSTVRSPASLIGEVRSWYLYSNSSSWGCPVMRVDWNKIANPNFDDGLALWGYTGTAPTAVGTAKGPGYTLAADTQLVSSNVPIAAGQALHVGTWGRNGLATSIRWSNLTRVNLAANPGFTSLLGMIAEGSAALSLSTAWYSTASPSLAITPQTGSTTATAALPYGSTGAMSLIGLVPGKSYTVSATIRQSAVQGGTVDALARSIVIVYTSANGTNPAYAYTQAPNLAGAQRISVTFTVPSDATNVYLRLTNGSTNAVDVVYWDDLLIEEVSGGTYRTNWCVNPQPAALLGTTRIDTTNLCTNPGLEGGSLNGFGSNTPARYPVSLDTTAPISGINSAMTTRTADTPNGYAAALSITAMADGSRVACTAGVPLTFSIDLKTENVRRIQTSANWWTSGGALVSNDTWTDLTAASTAGVATRYKRTYTPPATAAFVSFTVEVINSGGNAVTGERVWFDNVCVCSAIDGTYFDGATADSGPNSYAWTGPANASTSTRTVLSDWYSHNGITGLSLVTSPWNPTRKAVQCPGWTPGNVVTQGVNGSFEGNITGVAGTGSAPATVAYDTTRAHSGTGCLKITWGASTSQGSAAYATITGLIVGRPYTMEAWLYVPAGSESAAPSVGVQGGPLMVTSRVGVTATDQWVFSTGSFTASATSLVIYPAITTGTSTAGQVCYVDDFKVYQQLNHVVAGNNGTFEGALTGWVAAGSPTPTIAADTTRVHSGIGSMKITWGATVGGVAQCSAMTNLVVGHQYTVDAWLYIPSGSASAAVHITGIGYGSTVTARDQWVQSSLTFTATSTSHTVQIGTPTSPGTAGQVCYADDVRFYPSPPSYLLSPMSYSTKRYFTGQNVTIRAKVACSDPAQYVSLWARVRNPISTYPYTDFTPVRVGPGGQELVATFVVPYDIPAGELCVSVVASTATAGSAVPLATSTTLTVGGVAIEDGNQSTLPYFDGDGQFPMLANKVPYPNDTAASGATAARYTIYVNTSAAAGTITVQSFTYNNRPVVRIQPTGSPTTIVLGVRTASGPNTLAIPAGTTFWFSADVYVSAAVLGTQFSLILRDDVNNDSAAATPDASTPLARNIPGRDGWYRVSWKATVNPGRTVTGVYLTVPGTGGNQPVTGYLDTARWMVEYTSAAAPGAYDDSLTLPLPTARKNLLANPSAESPSGWSSNNASTWTATRNTLVVRSGTQSVGSTVASISGGTILSLYAVGTTGPALPLEANRTYTFSCWVRTSVSGCQGRALVSPYVGGVAQAGFTGSYVTLTPDTWTRVSVTFTTPAAGVITCHPGVEVGLISGNASVGMVAYADDANLEEGAVLGSYLDGAVSTAGLGHYWTGPSGASYSRQYILPVVIPGPYFDGNSSGAQWDGAISEQFTVISTVLVMTHTLTSLYRGEGKAIAPAGAEIAEIIYSGNNGEVGDVYAGVDFGSHEDPGNYEFTRFAIFDGTANGAKDLYGQPTVWTGTPDNSVSQVVPQLCTGWQAVLAPQGPNIHTIPSTAPPLYPPPAGSYAFPLGGIPRQSKGTVTGYRTIGAARGTAQYVSGEVSISVANAVICSVGIYGAANPTSPGTLIASWPITRAQVFEFHNVPIAGYAYFYFQVSYTENTNAAGYRIWLDQLALIPTDDQLEDYPGYFDGSSPGAAWDGPVGASTSTYYGGGRRCYAEVVDAIDISSMAGGSRAEFAVDMKIPGAFWEDMIQTTVNLALTNAQLLAAAGTQVSLDQLQGTTAPIDDAVLTLTVTGTVTGLTITDVATGAWLTIAGNLPTSGTVVIDNKNFTVMNGATSLIASVTRGGSNQLLPVTPVSAAAAPAMRFKATGTGSLTGTLVARRRYVLA